MSAATVFRRPDGRPVGRLVDGWLVKRVRTDVHQLRRPPAWAVDASHLRELRRLGAAGVRLVDERGAMWSASAASFEHYGLLVDRGHGHQVALPLAYWRVRRPDDATEQPALPGFETAVLR